MLVKLFCKNENNWQHFSYLAHLAKIDIFFCSKFQYYIGDDYKVFPYLINSNLKKSKKQPKNITQSSQDIPIQNWLLWKQHRDSVTRKICRGELTGQLFNARISLKMSLYMVAKS